MGAVLAVEWRGPLPFLWAAATEEYRPRWGARTSNPVEGLKHAPLGSTPTSSAINLFAQARHNAFKLFLTFT